MQMFEVSVAPGMEGRQTSVPAISFLSPYPRLAFR